MEQLIRISAAGVAAAILIMLLRGLKSELAAALTVCASVLMLGAVAATVADASGAVADLFSKAGLGSEQTAGLLKIIGAAYTAEFASSICRDMGETSVASKIELAGRIYIVLTAVPWAVTLVSAVKELGMQ